jgi:hypothetical protein
MGWTTIWAIFAQTHLATLLGTKEWDLFVGTIFPACFNEHVLQARDQCYGQMFSAILNTFLGENVGEPVRSIFCT